MARFATPYGEDFGDQVQYDNYNGSWGKIEELHKLQDQYSKAITVKHAEEQGWSWDEEIDNETGEILLNLYDYSEG